MTNEEKIKAIKQILGPEYEEVAIFAAKKSEIRDERTNSLVDADFRNGSSHDYELVTY